MKLTAQPSTDVIVNLAPDDGLTTLSQDNFVFNASNWDIPQLVQVFGVDDFVILESPYLARLTLQATSSDGNFFIPATPFNVLVADSDVASVFIQRYEHMSCSESNLLSTERTTFPILRTSQR